MWDRGLSTEGPQGVRRRGGQNEEKSDKESLVWSLRDWNPTQSCWSLARHVRIYTPSENEEKIRFFFLSRSRNNVSNIQCGPGAVLEMVKPEVDIKNRTSLHTVGNDSPAV